MKMTPQEQKRFVFVTVVVTVLSIAAIIVFLNLESDARQQGQQEVEAK